MSIDIAFASLRNSALSFEHTVAAVENGGALQSLESYSIFLHKIFVINNPPVFFWGGGG